MTPRKLLFVLFSGDTCRQNHALMYALDLHGKGYAVKLILEGEATRSVREIGIAGSRTGTLLREACDAGIVAGTCERASSGCASDDPSRKVAEVAREQGIGLLSGLAGHASIEPFLRDGYELVVL
ncbi:MAG TPA: hypothetical protein VMK12_25540 [Anaeromyxobacteraceae bacterium]|nr:hypothetical protein [Anaeromyxobacteraceae bacterium]